MFRKCSFLAAAWLLAAGQVFGATHVMTVDPSIDMAGAVAELRAAISSVNAGGGTVGLFPDGVYDFSNTVTYLNALPEISAQVTIQGNGATLRRASGAPSMRFVDVTSTGIVDVHNLTIVGGSAGNVGGNSGAGGAIRNTGELAMYNCTVRDSEANSSSSTLLGGAVHNAGSFTAVGCSFLNTASVTTAQTVTGVGIYSNGPVLNLQDCVIANHTVSSSNAVGSIRGAGLYVTAPNSHASSVTLTRCVVRDNYAESPNQVTGAGLSAEGLFPLPLSLVLDSCTISGNAGRGNGMGVVEGGGVYVFGSFNSPLSASFVNCTISGNSTQGTSSSGAGAHVVVHAPNAVFLADHCTITGNSIIGDGIGAGIQGIMPLGTVFLISNSIIAANSAAAAPDIGGGISSLSYSLVGDTGSFPLPAGFGNLLNVDAMLGPLADNGGGLLTHKLLAGSPAIDAADPASTATTDQRGQARPSDSGYGVRSDMGAVEMQLARLGGISLSDPDATDNSDATVYTNQNPVTLTLTGVGGASPSSLRWSRNADLAEHVDDTFGGSGPYSVALSPAGDGVKSVYVALPTADGLSEIRGASITLDTVAPVTEASVASGVVAQPDSTFDVGFTCSDATSGVQGVRLFYRHNGGTWTQYDTGLFTSSPISFDTSGTGGNGTYEFYTEGVDNAGNVEDKSAQPAEATVAYTNNTRVMGWQQIED